MEVFRLFLLSCALHGTTALVPARRSWFRAACAPSSATVAPSSPSPSLVLKHPDKLPAVALVSGDIMPALAFGTWKIGRDTTADMVFQALEHGYRHIDSAADYGNEKEVGEGIKRALSAGIITSREEIWVTSKLWSTHHAQTHVKEALLKSLIDLGLDYLDLYHIHFPIAIAHVPISERYPPGWAYDPAAAEPRVHFAKVSLRETWSAMEELVDEGRVRNLGMCNINVALLWDLLSYARVPPTVVQVERHVFNQKNNLVKFCHHLNIAVTAYSPLGAPSYIPIHLAKQIDSALESPIVKNIATEHKKSSAQVLLRWNFQTGATIITKTSVPSRLEENMDILNFHLSHDDLERLAELDKNLKFNDPAVFLKELHGFLPIFD